MSKNFYFVDDRGGIRKLTTKELKDIASNYSNEYPKTIQEAFDIICDHAGICECDAVCKGYEEAKEIAGR